MSDGEMTELQRLRTENQDLLKKVENLADANVYAAELLAALEEAHEREQALVQRGEELELQTQLDMILQEEREEELLLTRVAQALLEAESLGLKSATPRLIPSDDHEAVEEFRAKVSEMAPESIDGGEFLIPVVTKNGLSGIIAVHCDAKDKRWCDRWLRFLWSIGRQLGSALNRLRVADENLKMTGELIKARDEALESSRIKSAFLANMSHELRTPMNAILGYSEMLIEDMDCVSQETMLQDLGKIQSAGKHLLNLINDVLDLSRIEAGKMTVYIESIDLKKVISNVVDTVSPVIDRNRNRLKVVCPDDIGVMSSDLVKFQQCLLNLLSNAAKFTENGEVSLEVRCNHFGDSERLQFVVRDTGIGMTPDELSQLFQDFVQADSSTTRKYGGTGLGLSISRRFCQMLGGDILVESKPDVGSTFTIDLPRHHVDEKQGEGLAMPMSPVELARVAAESKEDGIPTILSIDDNPDSLELIRRSLEKDGFHVLTASSGQAGLELARRYRPDAITLDVMMPDLNGWQVLATLKADPDVNAIPVILLSVVENRDVGMALGAVDCLSKPVDWIRLSSVLDRHAVVAKQKSILIIEDDPDSSEIVVRLLSRSGWKIETATNGREALEKINASVPALIVLDLMMPVMDGFSFTEELRNHPQYRSIPIVVLTSKSLTPEDHRRLNGQVEAIMNKGQGARQLLLESVKSLIGASS
jgi:signal transduction histidine kinase/CheY-like chemotaxis protein